MNVRIEQSRDNKSGANANGSAQRQAANQPVLQQVVGKGEMSVQENMQETVNNSPQLKQLKAYQAMANNSPQVKQLRAVQAMADTYQKQAKAVPAESTPGKAGKSLTGAESSQQTVQLAWNTAGVNNVLAPQEAGRGAVADLNAQNYSVIHFDSYTFNRQFYGGPFNWFKQGDPVPMRKNGWHSRGRLEIAISDQSDNNGAASTLVHEVAHANQHHLNEQNRLGGLDPAFRDTNAKEVDAHIKQEEFNIPAGIPPKHPSFRNADGAIDRNAIAVYVERVYAVGGQAREYVDTVPVYNVIETIRPWPVPVAPAAPAADAVAVPAPED